MVSSWESLPRLPKDRPLGLCFVVKQRAKLPTLYFVRAGLAHPRGGDPKPRRQGVIMCSPSPAVLCSTSFPTTVLTNSPPNSLGHFVSVAFKGTGLQTNCLRQFGRRSPDNEGGSDHFVKRSLVILRFVVSSFSGASFGTDGANERRLVLCGGVGNFDE